MILYLNVFHIINVTFKMKYDSISILIVIIKIIIIINIIGINKSVCCPLDVCVCKWKGGKQTVECGGKFLSTLPNGMDHGTQVLNFSGNSLQAIQSERFLKMDLINLQKIYLSRNNLTRIHDRAFKGLSNLVELDLSENMLTIIPSETFQDYTSLMRLTMNGNPIRELKMNAFKHLSFLTTLELSNCQIDTVEDESFIGLDNLEWLRLDGNRIGTIKGKHLLPKSLHGINLHGNHWNCDCHMIDLYIWLQNYNIPQQIEEPKCTQPIRLNSRTIKSLQLNELACTPNISLSTEFLKIAEGQNTTLECSITSMPDALITWWFEGHQLQNDSNGIIFVSAVTLASTAKPTSPTTPGTTTFTISSPQSSSSSSSTLSQTNVLNEEYNSQQHSYFIDYLTFGNSTTISKLLIFNTSINDNGTFMCIAENFAGSTQVNYTILIVVKHESIAEQIDVFPYESIFLLIIIGAGVGAFLFVFICCCIIIKCNKRKCSDRRQRQQDQQQADQNQSKRNKKNKRNKDLQKNVNNQSGSDSGSNTHLGNATTLHNNVNNQIKCSSIMNNVFNQHDIPILKANGTINMSQQDMILYYNHQNPPHHEMSQSISNMINTPGNNLTSPITGGGPISPIPSLSFSPTPLSYSQASNNTVITSSSTSIPQALTKTSSTLSLTSKNPHYTTPSPLSLPQHQLSATQQRHSHQTSTVRTLQDQNPDLINDTESVNKRLIKNDNMDDCSNNGSDHSSMQNYNYENQLFNHQQPQPKQQLSSQIFQRSASTTSSTSAMSSGVRYNPMMSTLPRGGLNKDLYKQQIDVQLNPGCFLGPQDGYPIEYRLINTNGCPGATGAINSTIHQPVMSHLMHQHQLQLQNQQNLQLQHHHQQQQQQQHLSGNNSINYYRTLPHKTKLNSMGSLSATPRYSLEAEFINRTSTPPPLLQQSSLPHPPSQMSPQQHQQFDIYSLKKDLRYTIEGSYPRQPYHQSQNIMPSQHPIKQVAFADQQQPSHHQFIPSPPEGYKSEQTLTTTTSSITTSALPITTTNNNNNNNNTNHQTSSQTTQWPACLPGGMYHSQIVPIKTQHSQMVSNDIKAKQRLYAATSTKSSSPSASQSSNQTLRSTATASTDTTSLSTTTNASRLPTKRCVGAQTTDLNDSVILEHDHENDDDRDQNIIEDDEDNDNDGNARRHDNEEDDDDDEDEDNGSNNDCDKPNCNNVNTVKLRQLTGPLADSPDEGYVGDSQDGSDM